MSFSNVLILKPSASPVWLPCEGEGVSPQTPRVWWEAGHNTTLTYVVEKIPDFEDQLAEDGQPLAGKQACDRWAGLNKARHSTRKDTRQGLYGTTDLSTINRLRGSGITFCNARPDCWIVYGHDPVLWVRTLECQRSFYPSVATLVLRSVG